MANGVEIAVPVPSDADSPKFKTSVGSARYLPEKNLVLWTIKSFAVRPPATVPVSPPPRRRAAPTPAVPVSRRVGRST